MFGNSSISGPPTSVRVGVTLGFYDAYSLMISNWDFHMRVHGNTVCKVRVWIRQDNNNYYSDLSQNPCVMDEISIHFVLIVIHVHQGSWQENAIAKI